jgi:hypothetical protein
MAESMARVQGEGKRLGRTPKDIPDGYISWDEHHQAWEIYQRRWSGQSSEDIEARGGFGYNELKTLFGRPPRTWVPRDVERFKDFVFDEEDRPGYEAEPEAVVVDERHIYHVGGDMICSVNVPIPTIGPIYFDDVEAPGCEKCFARMVDWLDWFTGSNKVEE